MTEGPGPVRPRACPFHIASPKLHASTGHHEYHKSPLLLPLSSLSFSSQGVLSTSGLRVARICAIGGFKAALVAIQSRSIDSLHFGSGGLRVASSGIFHGFNQRPCMRHTVKEHRQLAHSWDQSAAVGAPSFGRTPAPTRQGIQGGAVRRWLMT